MFYPYQIEKQDGKFRCIIRDLQFYSEGATEEEARELIQDGLYRYIEETYRKAGKPIPMPSSGDPTKDYLFYVDIKDEARILLWNILREKHMSTSEFSRLLGISRQYAQYMVDGSSSVSMQKYTEAFIALGYYPSLELNPYK